MEWLNLAERTHPADESTQLPGGEVIVDSREDGNGDDDVAEEAAQVVKGVHPDWSKEERLGSR